MKNVIDYSHLLEGYEEEYKNKRAEELVECILNTMRDEKGNISPTQSFRQGYFDDIEKFYNLTEYDNTDMACKLYNIAWWYADAFKCGFDITDFFMICMQIKQKAGASNIQMETIIKAGLAQGASYSNINFNDVFYSIDAISTVLAALQEKKSQDERNFIDTKFIKLEDGVFIEKKDNQIYYLEIDKETGEMKERPIMSVATTGRYGDFLVTDYDKFPYMPQLYRIPSKDGNDTFKIAIDESFENVCINKGYQNRKVEILNGVKGLAEDYMINAVLEDFIDLSGHYVNIENDAENPYDIPGVMYSVDIDERSKKIDFEGYLEELKGLIGTFSIQCQEKALTMVLENMFERFGNVSKNNYNDVYALCRNYLMEASKVEEKLEILNKLNECTDVMNEERKTKARENKKIVIVTFRNPIAEERYTSTMQVKKIEHEKKVADLFLIDAINECIEEQADYSITDFPGAIMTGDFEERKANTVNFNKYIEILKETLKEIDEESKESFVNSNVEKSLKILYGNINASRKEGRERSYIYYRMASEIASLVLNNLDISNEFIETMNELQERLNKKNEELDDETRKKAVITFANPQIEALYRKSKEIEANSDIPEDAKKMVIDSLKLAANVNMADMAKSALQGPNMATENSVAAYDSHMNSDKKVGVDI